MRVVDELLHVLNEADVEPAQIRVLLEGGQDARQILIKLRAADPDTLDRLAGCAEHHGLRTHAAGDRGIVIELRDEID
jgi:hypothetical protein